MRVQSRTPTAALAVAAFAATVLASAPASAKVIERDSFRDNFSNTIEDFCGVPGLDIQNEGYFDARYTLHTRGKNQNIYFMQHSTLRSTLTNEATGRSVTEWQRTIEKDLAVTDNGDGTLTILILATGNATVYGSNGKAIARNPGQVRFEILIDHGGTPSDPSDDEFLEFLGFVKDSTGRSDDFCTAVVNALI